LYSKSNCKKLTSRISSSLTVIGRFFTAYDLARLYYFHCRRLFNLWTVHLEKALLQWGRRGVKERKAQKGRDALISLWANVIFRKFRDVGVLGFKEVVCRTRYMYGIVQLKFNLARVRHNFGASIPLLSIRRSLFFDGYKVFAVYLSLRKI